MSNFTDAIRVLEALGYEPRAYSGRGMYGKRCVAIELTDQAELWKLAVDIGSTMEKVFSFSWSTITDIRRPPKIDSMGRGIVAYWPSIEWEVE